VAKYGRIFLKHPYIFLATYLNHVYKFGDFFGDFWQFFFKKPLNFSPRKEAESNSLYEFYNDECWIAINCHHTRKSLGILAQVLKTLHSLNVETLMIETLTLKH
jgi:hypothetical protein